MKRFTVTFFIRSASKDNDKKVKIRIRISYGKNEKQYSDTRVLIKLGDWNKSGQKAYLRKNVPENEEINNTLNSLRTDLEKWLSEDLKKGDIPADWLQTAIDKHFNPEKYEEKKETLFSFIREFIEGADTRINPRTGRPVSYKMKREYERTFNYLQEYASRTGKEPDFKDIDLYFYDDFVKFLQSTFTTVLKNGKTKKYTLSTNTIGKKIQTLKIFLNDATERGINTNLKFKSNKFISVTEVAETIHLNEQELNQLYEYDFSEDKRLERVRDLFLVGCWTGLRFSDLSKLRPENIQNGYFYVTQTKTGGKVVIPVHPVVKAIMNKYKGNLPPAISNQKFNKYLQELAEIAEIDTEVHKGITKGGKRISKKYRKYELLTTHTARRSFATNLYNRKFPAQSIMAITGHKTEAAFLKYLKVTPEDHAKLLQDFWNENANHLKVV